MKSSVSRKRLLKAPEYSNTRRSAAFFAKPQKLAAIVYRQLTVPELDHKGLVSFAQQGAGTGEKTGACGGDHPATEKGIY